mmetsp:Transcript_22229/g.40052  ORF Transcript_22229/g.40052 Transcript_22229/m.40052 type:complete len:177 (-) Transcript_22229:8-538(-)
MMQLSVASILSLWFMLLGGTASQKCGADNPFCQEEDGSNYMLQHDAGHVRSKSKVQATEETGSNTSERVNTSSNASWSWGGGSDCISLTPADGCRPIAACTDSNVLCCLPVIPYQYTCTNPPIFTESSTACGSGQLCDAPWFIPGVSTGDQQYGTCQCSSLLYSSCSNKVCVSTFR